MEKLILKYDKEYEQLERRLRRIEHNIEILNNICKKFKNIDEKKEDNNLIYTRRNRISKIKRKLNNFISNLSDTIQDLENLEDYIKYYGV